MELDPHPDVHNADNYTASLPTNMSGEETPEANTIAEKGKEVGSAIDHPHLRETKRMPSFHNHERDHNPHEFRDVHHCEERRNPETGKIQVNNYQLEERLGSGSYGQVYRCIDLDAKGDEDSEYAVKVLDKKKLRRNMSGPLKPPKPGEPRVRPRNALDDCMTEIAIMKKLDHPNIVNLVEVIDDETSNKLYLFMELCDGGEPIHLEDHDTTAQLPLETARSYLRDIIHGLDYLHAHNIIHRDIKPANCLLWDNELKLTDFGVSTICDEDDTISNTKGTPAFYAPELCAGGVVHGKMTDIWAVGCCLYCFVYGKLPFEANQGGYGGMVALMDMIQNEDVEYPDTPEIDANLKDLFQAFFEKDPSKRITIDELMAHPWVTNNGAEPMTDIDHPALSVNEEDITTAFTRISARVHMSDVVWPAMVANKVAREFLEKSRNGSGADGDESEPAEPAAAAASEGDANIDPELLQTTVLPEDEAHSSNQVEESANESESAGANESEGANESSGEPVGEEGGDNNGEDNNAAAE